MSLLLYLSLPVCLSHFVSECFCLSVCLSVSVFQCLCLSVGLCLSVPLSLSVCLSLFVSQCFCLSACLSVCLSVDRSLSPSVSVSVCLSVGRSVSLSLSLLSSTPHLFSFFLSSFFLDSGTKYRARQCPQTTVVFTVASTSPSTIVIDRMTLTILVYIYGCTTPRSAWPVGLDAAQRIVERSHR